jgi:hypothetical protein
MGFNRRKMEDQRRQHTRLGDVHCNAPCLVEPPLRIARLLIWVQTYRVDYRGIRYTIRARIEREQWSVAIHPTGVEVKGRVVSGPREKAELQARAMINSWLKTHSTQKLKSD